jgi:hypothetical protein
MHILLSKREFDTLVEKRRIKEVFQRSLFELRAEGCQEGKFNFIACALETVARECGVELNRDWRP